MAIFGGSFNPPHIAHVLLAVYALSTEPIDEVVIGADVVNDLPKWHRFDRIAEIAPPIIVGRMGVVADGVPEAILPRVSSTEVREAFARHDVVRLEKLVPRDVLALIEERGLYRRN